jgi:hypothetical protein
MGVSLRTHTPKEYSKISVRELHNLRMKIPAGQIVRRLGGFAVGAWETVRVPSEHKGEALFEERPIEMNANQVRAAIALLNKVMPDLQSMQMELTDNRMEGQTIETLRAQLRSIVMQSDVIDVPTIQSIPDEVNLLSLDGMVSESDLLDLS